MCANFLSTTIFFKVQVHSLRPEFELVLKKVKNSFINLKNQCLCDVLTNIMFHICDTYPLKIPLVGKDLKPNFPKDPFQLAGLSMATIVHYVAPPQKLVMTRICLIAFALKFTRTTMCYYEVSKCGNIY